MDLFGRFLRATYTRHLMREALSGTHRISDVYKAIDSCAKEGGNKLEVRVDPGKTNEVLTKLRFEGYGAEKSHTIDTYGFNDDVIKIEW